MTFPIENQEQLDSVLSDRLNRAKKTAVNGLLNKFGLTSEDEIRVLLESSDEVKNTINSLNGKIKEKEKEISDLSDKIKELEKTSKSVEGLTQERDDLKKQLDDFNNQLIVDKKKSLLLTSIEDTNFIPEAKDDLINLMLEKAEFNEEVTEIKDIDNLVKTIKTEKPYYFAQGKQTRYSQNGTNQQSKLSSKEILEKHLRSY